MAYVQIGSAQRSLEDALRGGWIPQQIQGRRHDGVDACVRVYLPEASLTLQTADCPCGLGGGGGLNGVQASIVESWRRHGLDQPGYPPGALVAFLRDVLRAVA